MIHKHKWLLFFLAGMVASTFIAAANLPVRAQQATPSDDEVNAIASQLFCPVCENTPLDVCPTEACRQWRDLIRQMLAEGRSADEIKQYFVENYGARVLSEPPRTGLNWLVYVVPPAAFLFGAYLLFRAFMIWRHQAAESSSTPSTGLDSPPEKIDGDYVARLEEELKRRK
jgi:cytochrome c-type biogenesis protein CcmH